MKDIDRKLAMAFSKMTRDEKIYFLGAVETVSSKAKNFIK